MLKNCPTAAAQQQQQHEGSNLRAFDQQETCWGIAIALSAALAFLSTPLLRRPFMAAATVAAAAGVDTFCQLADYVVSVSGLLLLLLHS